MNPESDPEEETYDSPPKAKIFCGFIYVPELELEEVLHLLERAWGPVAFISQRFPFDSTRYYTEEMGSPLSRKFVVFREEVEQDALPGLKWQAKRVESAYRNPSGGRRVNIDPGVFLPQRLVLATTKPAAHRPYLDRGVYADLTLMYQEGSYQPLAWTYPDYAAPHTIEMMNRLRERWLFQRRAARRGWIV
jgi:Domain of unknown function (DUF4416)